MEAITKVKLNATLKGSAIWEAGVYDAPVPSELIEEANARTLTREGTRMVEILERKASKVVPILSPEAPTSISSVTSSNVRDGAIFEAENKDKVPTEERKEPDSKPTLSLRR